jgi:tripartite-type tricarboxylate transporter receptor subunit TctC
MKTRIVAMLIGALACGQAAFAQQYPTRAIRMIIPFAPGGPNDILGRVVAQKLSEQLGQQLVVDNRAGAGGVIAAQAAANAVPDGYTLLLGGTATMSINPHLHRNLGYDPIKDFASISLIGTSPSLVTINASLPVQNIKDLIALAKSKPGQLTFASSGPGTAPHLGGELMKTMAGIDMVHVPYKGGALAYTDLLSGQVTMFIGGISAALPHIKAGKLRGIAVTSLKRTDLLPGVPTVSESGLPGYEVINWYSIVTTAGTPKPVVARLNSETVKAVASDAVRKRYVELGTDPASGTPAQLDAYTRSEIAKWGKVIKLAGMKPE